MIYPVMDIKNSRHDAIYSIISISFHRYDSVSIEDLEIKNRTCLAPIPVVEVIVIPHLMRNPNLFDFCFVILHSTV